MISRLFTSAALALGLVVVAAPAFAQPVQKDAAQQCEGKAKHSKREKPSFPMKAEEFKKVIDAQAARADKHLDRILEKNKASDAVRAQVKKDLSTARQALTALVSTVSADGTVTKEEAKQVRKLSHELKSQALSKSGIKAPEKKERGERRARGEKRAPVKS